MNLKNNEKKGQGFKKNVTAEVSFFMNKLKETIIDACGIGWIFEDGLSNAWAAIVVVILWYVRWMIKLGIFIYGTLLITAWLCPHSGAKFW